MKTLLTDSQSLLTATQKAPDSTMSRKRESLKKSGQNFEALFIQSVLKSMRQTVPEGGLFKKDNATSMFEDMLDQELAATMAKKQSIGLADQIYRQMENKLPDK